MASYKLPQKVAVDVSEHFLLADIGDTINLLFGGTIMPTCNMREAHDYEVGRTAV